MEISLILDNKLIVNKVITKKDVLKTGIKVLTITSLTLALTNIPVLATVPKKDVGSFFAPVSDMNAIDRLFGIYFPIDFECFKYILGLTGEATKNEIVKALGIDVVEVVRFFR